MTHTVRSLLIVSVGFAALGVSADEARAEQSVLRPAPRPEIQLASLSSGKVRGLVRDDRGQAVGGVQISALGTSKMAQITTSDASGRFSLSLPPGEYVLRAHRDGYVTSFRESVRVRPSSAIEKNVTVMRESGPASRPVMVAGVNAPGRVTPATPIAGESEHPHDEMAWRMRQLKRPVLRNTAPVVAEAARAQNFKSRSNFFDWALSSSARLATSFFVDTDFTGQVNFLTTSAIDPASGRFSPGVPRSVAYVSVSAPVASYGDWRVRASMNANDLSSWVMLGEFVGRPGRAHVFDAGASYGTQAYSGISTAAFSTVTGASRSVGAIYGNDHWRIADGVELDYGLRLDRSSYVTGEDAMLSPRMAGRARLFSRISVVGQAAQHVIAPGSTEFMPTASAGPWLPPQRTFSALYSSPTSSGFRAERVRHFDVGLEHQFKGGDRRLAVRRLWQISNHQTATIFGVNDMIGSSGWAAGHYTTASVGTAEIDGVSVRASGSLSKRFTGSVEYTVAQADWARGGSATRLRQIAPSVVRDGSERLHDLLTSLDMVIPESETRLSMVYRVNSAFGRAGSDVTPGFGGRFDLQVNQALPFQPLRGGRLEVLVAVSNLFRDLRQSGSLFDELLTVSPPTRILGGFQIRF
jgi:hypothetical protein